MSITNRRVIYLHGFRSSPQSAKALWLHARMQEIGHAVRFVCPQLPASPREAVYLIKSQYDLQPDDTLVGSSLGGFYATHLAENFGCRAVLLNPAIYPARDLKSYVGTHKMYHSEASFEFRSEYLQELRDLEVPVITFTQRYFLVSAKGDELIDWRDMVKLYAGAKLLLLERSDHGLSDFADYGDEVLQFAGLMAVTGH